MYSRDFIMQRICAAQWIWHVLIWYETTRNATNGQTENVNRRGIDNIIATKKTKQWSKNTTQEPKEWATQTTHNTWDEFRCSGRVSYSCSTEIRNSFSMINIKRMTVEALISKWATLIHIRGNCCFLKLIYKGAISLDVYYRLCIYEITYLYDI
jgi:hypothetical protein